jgi:hypothetical protein
MSGLSLGQGLRSGIMLMSDKSRACVQHLGYHVSVESYHGVAPKYVVLPIGSEH